MKSKKIKPTDINNPAGYPNYPENEDIYKKDIETDLDPEKLAEIPAKAENGADELSSKPKRNNTGSDLDIPGAELDDAAEESGNEDEENNYYSLGGDANSALDEENSEK